MTYKNVYFRVDAGYKWGEGMDAIPKAAFYDEIKTLFERAGWVAKNPEFSCSCPTVHKGLSSLYCHPMQLSGVIDETLISEINEILINGKTFKHRCTDEFETIRDMSDEDYRAYLDGNRDQIRNDIAKIFKTKRNNLFYDENNAGKLLNSVGEKWHIHRIQNGENWRQANRIEAEIISDIFRKMIADGVIVESETKNGKGYRTAKRAA